MRGLIIRKSRLVRCGLPRPALVSTLLHDVRLSVYDQADRAVSAQQHTIINPDPALEVLGAIAPVLKACSHLDTFAPVVPIKILLQ
jgi:hypothetical protein